MELNLLSLKGSAMYSNVVWAIDRFHMALGSLPANVQDCVPHLLKDWHGVSSPRDCWLLGRAWS